MIDNLDLDIFNICNVDDFHEIALKIFRYQAQTNNVYKDYLTHININPVDINSINKIPFLPIEFFKTHKVRCNQSTNGIIFTSSGTSKEGVSKHYVSDLSLYELSFIKTFELFYGDISQYCILALLPNYLERKGSSLVYMTKKFIEKTKHPNSDFYLYDTEKLVSTLIDLKQKNQKTILIGVTYALLDLAENYKLNLENVIVIETGGMKGKRKEIIRKELHSKLKKSFNFSNIHSEYGMTEMLSQSYSKGNGQFLCPP